MGTIGFFNLTDFCNDIAEFGLPVYPVRVQQYHLAHHSRTLPLVEYIFYLEAAYQNASRGEVLVCRFRVGSASVMGNHPQEREKISKLEERSQALYELLLNRLRQELAGRIELKIRPGIIAVADECKTEADLSSLETEPCLTNTLNGSIA